MECVRFTFLWLAVLFVSAVNLYSNNKPAETLTRSENFTRFEENGKVGLKDDEGQILIPANYEAIGWSDGRLSIIDKVVGYQVDGLWGLIHTSNKVVTHAEYLSLKPGEGSFLVAQKKSSLSQRPAFGVINTSGKVIIPLQYDGLSLSNMRAVVMSRSGTRFLFGLSDLAHRMVIPVEFKQIFSLGSLRFAVENFENKTAIFSEDGDQVTTFSIDSISSFKKDYAIVYQNQRQGLISRNGQFILQPTFGEVRLHDNGAIEMRDLNAWFFLDGENNLVARCDADVVASLSPEHYGIKNGGKVRLTNNRFEPLHESIFSSISDFRNGIAIYRSGGKTGIITSDGKVLIPAQYQELKVDGNVFLARMDTGYKNRWTILDAHGNQLTEKHYEHIAPFNGKFFPVQNRGFWGAVDKHGKEIVTCVHDSIMQQQGNNLVVKFKGQYGIITVEESWIVTPQPHPLIALDNELYFEIAGTTTFLKSFAGDIIYFSENPLVYENGHVRERLPSGAYWLIDRSGTIVNRSSQPDRTDQILPESEGLRAISKDGKFGFIDDAGRLRIANRYEAVRPFQDGLAAIRIRNRWGFIDRYEKLVVQPVYDQVEDFKAGFAIVKQDGITGLLDEQGRVVLPLRYDEIVRNSQNRFTLRQGKLFGMADANGTVIIHPKYDALVDTGNGYVVVQRNGKFGVLTTNGVSTIPMIYDGLTYDAHRNQYMAIKHAPWKPFNP